MSEVSLRRAEFHRNLKLNRMKASSDVNVSDQSYTTETTCAYVDRQTIASRIKNIEDLTWGSVLARIVAEVPYGI